MPLLASDCIETPDLCCGALFAFAEYLRCESMAALAGCFTDGACDDLFVSYVSMGAGDDGIGDSLIVTVNAMNPSTGTRSVGFSVWNMTFDVRLRESGYPMVAASGTAVVPPDPVLQHQATAQLFAHGEAIHRRLSALKTKGQLAPEGYRCLDGTVGSMQPLTPTGGVAGWTILVTIPMPWN